MIDDSSRASNQEYVQQQDSKPLTLFDLLRILRAVLSGMKILNRVPLGK